jgi:hypothetical protein
MPKETKDSGVYGTLTGIIYCPQSNHYIYMINGDPVAIYDDKLIVNTSKCNPISNENDELRTDVLKELITILLDSTLTVQENIKKLKQ